MIKKIKNKLLNINNKKSKYTSELIEYEKYNIGKRTYGAPNILDWEDGTSLTIGNYCSIAKDVNILVGGEHHSEWVTTYPFNSLNQSTHDQEEFIDHKSKGNIIIGSDVWIGRGATILSGIKIGDGAIIGAKSLVTKNVPDYTIVGGNPAKIIRQRFSDKIISELIEIKWWNWPETKILEARSVLLSNDIENFIKWCEK